MVALSITSSLREAAALAITRTTLNVLDEPHLSYAEGGEVIVLIAVTRWRVVADDLLARLRSSNAVAFSVGVGRQETLRGIERTVQQARHARRVSQTNHLPLVEFDAMGVFGILLGSHTSAMLEDLADNVLAPLDSYDRGGGASSRP